MMPNDEPPPAPTPGPTDPTQPIRPTQGGSEPIPERVRQPIVVPHQESTIAGLPRAFAVAGIVALVIALAVGFFIGRSVGGDDQGTAEGAESRGRGCGKALALSLQVLELQDQALEIRTQSVEAVAAGDEGRLLELNSTLETLAPAIQEARTQLDEAVEKCRNGRGGKRKDNRKGGNSEQGGGG